MSYTLYFDGACLNGNPGGIAIASWVINRPAPWSVLLEEGAKEVCRGAGATNNVAEWAGLCHGLTALSDYTRGAIEIRGDSQLVIYQLTGRFRVKKQHLKPWKNKAMATLKLFRSWNAEYIPRRFNEHADRVGKDMFRHLAETDGHKTMAKYDHYQGGGGPYKQL